MPDEMGGRRDIVVYERGGRLSRISELSRQYDPLLYVALLHPRGTDGWSLQLKTERGVTMRQYAAFRMRYRPGHFNLIPRGGRLYQQYLVDTLLKVEADSLSYVRTHQDGLNGFRAETIRGVRDALADGEEHARALQAEQAQRAAAAKAELARRLAEADAEQARRQAEQAQQQAEAQAEQSRRQAEQAEAQAALEAQAAKDEAECCQLELELLEQEERGSQPRSSTPSSVAGLPVVATEPPARVCVSRQTDESVTRTRQWLAQSQPHVPPAYTAPVGTLPPPAVRLQHPSRDDNRAVPHLPRITLEKFGGSAIEWPRWIALFKALVHDRADLTDVERLTYLQTHLTGPAKESVRGMLCDASLYSTALGELEREFGDPSRVIHATMKRLLTARPVKDGDLSALTELSRELHTAVVPITVNGPAGSRTTNALFDLGSQVTLITDDLCDRLGISGPTDKLVLSTLSGTQTTTSRRVSFAVEAVGGDGRAHRIRNAQTTPRLNVSAKAMDCTVAKEKWPHLADLDLPSATHGPVEVLLGTDVIELIVPREVIEGPTGTLCAVRTLLGWTVTGRASERSVLDGLRRDGGLTVFNGTPPVRHGPVYDVANVALRTTRPTWPYENAIRFSELRL
ncbi:hypothetical protein FJT64_001893 [Amphibalanus amphitrite]|uniref:Helitron helicase-like domain-containing protein n=1 Tax=Amphibalanus amphitrite TaxID=1232801 RepID=A0A6A4WT35_AMPAM|nr:hypothetical protein FJT64_001893 [Amphibalanus amphitrite]